MLRPIALSSYFIGQYTVRLEAYLNGCNSGAVVKSIVLPLTIVDQEVTTAESGTAYRAQLFATGGRPPYVWNIIGKGELPVGIGLTTPATPPKGPRLSTKIGCDAMSVGASIVATRNSGGLNRTL